MKVVTAAIMQEIDRRAIEEFGLPGEILMNSAGRFVADYIESNYKDVTVNIVCGTGNNGGDGFTAAYYLANHKRRVRVILCGSMERVSPVSRIFMNLCIKAGLSIESADSTQQAEEIIFENGIIIDSVFGTGFRGTPEGIHRIMIEKINRSNLEVVSVDIPSGMQSDGEITSQCIVKASCTVTIGLPKISLVTYPGKHYCGELAVADIGFPSSLTGSSDLTVELADRNWMINRKPVDYKFDLHKGERGHTLLIGGFPGMEGALLLAASALFRTGAGLATAATAPESRRIIAGRIRELMTTAIPEEDTAGHTADLIMNSRFDSLLIGPGMGRTPYSSTVFSSAVSAAAQKGLKRVLIDGDGLYHLAEYLKHQSLPRGPVYCITPHFMEASRLTGKSVAELKRDRLRSCMELALNTSCITVLKGPATIVSDGTRSFINTTGNSLMATAGSGDVLSGIITSLMNSNSDVLEAAVSGVFIHGLCADICLHNLKKNSITAGDLITLIDNASAQLTLQKD